jgi:hypothetical protein
MCIMARLLISGMNDTAETAILQLIAALSIEEYVDNDRVNNNDLI